MPYRVLIRKILTLKSGLLAIGFITGIILSLSAFIKLPAKIDELTRKHDVLAAVEDAVVRRLDVLICIDAKLEPVRNCLAKK